MFRNTSQTSQAAMNMLFNAERPRFDSHLRSARLLPQRATGASAPLATATQQPVSWVPSFRFRWLPRCACAATGRERLDSRFLKVPDQAGCRGSGAPPGAQSCAAGAQSCAAGAHAASPCHARVGDSGDHQRPPPPQTERTPAVPSPRCGYALLTRACSVLTWTSISSCTG